MPDTYQPPPSLLTAEDSKRVADAMLAAIEEMRIAMTCQHEVMCQHMTNNHWNWLLQHVPSGR